MISLFIDIAEKETSVFSIKMFIKIKQPEARQKIGALLFLSAGAYDGNKTGQTNVSQNFGAIWT